MKIPPRPAWASSSQATNLPGRFRCVNCLSRYELVSQCRNCGAHQTIVRLTKSEDLVCQHCGDSMLNPV